MTTEMGKNRTVRRSIAVIGGGVSGLTTAWLLRHRYRVTLFERNDYIGGHSHTVEVPGPDGPMPVDTGFMVFNDRNYPGLRRLFQHLGVADKKTDMSFSVSLDGGRLEWAGSDINGLFAQRSNLVRPGFLRMILEILRFNRQAKAFLDGQGKGLGLSDESLGQWLDRHGFGPSLQQDYLLPMAAAIWSCPTETMRRFPARFLLDFFENHGLLDLTNRPQWFTVEGGSRSYVRRMLADLEHPSSDVEVVTSAGIEQVERSRQGIAIRRKGGLIEHFDLAVMACHSDEALNLLHTPLAAERELLSAIRYQPNRVYLHSDTALMPRRQAAWSSWNYLRDERVSGESGVLVSYWMNRLQSLPRRDAEGPRDWFVTLNPPLPPASELTARVFDYDHPILDLGAERARRLLSTIQGADRIWFAGAYFGSGFHEDGFQSAMNVARRLGVVAPWETDDLASIAGLHPRRQATADRVAA